MIAQSLQTKREQQHRHLDLQELRRDLPMVKDRDDPQAAVLQEPADTAAVTED